MESCFEDIECGKWIKCCEEMPKKDGCYLVCVPYYSTAWIGASSFRNGKFDDDAATYWRFLPGFPT